MLAPISCKPNVFGGHKMMILVIYGFLYHLYLILSVYYT